MMVEKKYSAEPCPRCKKERADGTLGENYRCEACRILFFEWKMSQKDEFIEQLEANIKRKDAYINEGVHCPHVAELREKLAELELLKCTKDNCEFLRDGLAEKDKELKDLKDQMKQCPGPTPGSRCPIVS